MSARQRLRADLARYYSYQRRPDNPLECLKTIVVTEGIWAILLYRFGQYLHNEAPGALRVMLRIPYEIVRKALRLLIGIHLHPVTPIGPGLYIGHYGGIWITGKCRIGSNCSISQGVIIGVAAADSRGGPVLGDRVWVGPGATVCGPVRVGSGAVIGANSLVASNIPENGVAVGVPARVVSYTGSSKLIRTIESCTPPDVGIG